MYTIDAAKAAAALSHVPPVLRYIVRNFQAQVKRTI